MGILDDLTRMIPDKEDSKNSIYESDIKFDLEYKEEDGTYSVLNKDQKCCVLEFVNTQTDRTVEIDDAQLEPEYHIAFISQLNEGYETFTAKLDDMGFDNISIEENDELDEAPIKFDFVSEDGRLGYKIVKDREWSEWQAKAYIDGKFNDYKTAHESDDAEGKNQVAYAAKAGIKNWNAMTDEKKDEAKADAIKWDQENKIVESENNLTETSNNDVIIQFIADSFAHNEEEAEEMGVDNFSTVWGSTNLKISKQDNGWALINYDTPLMFRSEDGKLYFNTDKYSATTTRIQDDIKNGIGDTEVQEVDEEGIKDVIK